MRAALKNEKSVQFLGDWQMDWVSFATAYYFATISCRVIWLLQKSVNWLERYKSRREKQKNDYYKWQLRFEHCNSNSEKNNLYGQVGWDCSGNRKMKCASLVFSVGSEKIPYNFSTLKLNTMLNFNEKIFVNMLSFYNRLWLNLNGGESKKSEN